MKQNEIRRAICTANMVKFKTTSKKRKQAEDGIYMGGKARAQLLKKKMKLQKICHVTIKSLESGLNHIKSPHFTCF